MTLPHWVRLLGAVNLLAWAGHAVAQAPPGATPLARVFISPSGEPFRPGPGIPDPFEAWFSRVDANHDGRIDRAEFRADAMAFFKRLDANGDGVVDGFEITDYETTIAPEVVDHALGAGRGPLTLLNEPEPVSGADLDLNSRVSAQEWLDVADRRFDLLDRKKQSFLDHDGLRALLAKSAKGPK
jgi:hypothetical protein